MISLTHYTHEIDTLKKILDYGFAYVPNKRGLISDFLPNHNFEEREPQQFGMISFTGLPLINAKKHKNDFGKYGVIVSNEWANSHNIQKVIYIDNKGPVFESLQNLFKQGYDDLIHKSMLREKEVSEMSFTNKERAKIAGGYIYSNLMQLYEYMEPIHNSYQQEWRITHPSPYYGYAKTKEEIIQNVSPPKNWAKILNVLPVKPKDISGFVCPEKDMAVLQNILKPEIKSVRIDTY